MDDKLELSVASAEKFTITANSPIFATPPYYCPKHGKVEGFGMVNRAKSESEGFRCVRVAITPLED